ncbi:MAG: hypothetical protein LAT82_03005 [Nanoarchaeota archaeon]|nr:hypothetical protein [Nanoarchaeota archaeon]
MTILFSSYVQKIKLPRDEDYNLFLNQISRGRRVPSQVREFFKDYSIFLQGDNLLSRSYYISRTPIINTSKKDLEHRCLIFECITIPKISNDIFDDDTYDYSTIFNCTGSVMLHNGKFLTVSSQSYSKHLTDEEFYDDLRGVSHLLRPDVMVDIYRDDYCDTFEEGLEPVRIKNCEIEEGEILPLRGKIL